MRPLIFNTIQKTNMNFQSREYLTFVAVSDEFLTNGDVL